MAVITSMTNVGRGRLKGYVSSVLTCNIITFKLHLWILAQLALRDGRYQTEVWCPSSQCHCDDRERWYNAFPRPGSQSPQSCRQQPVWHPYYNGCGWGQVRGCHYNIHLWNDSTSINVVLQVVVFLFRCGRSSNIIVFITLPESISEIRWS